MSRDQCFQQKNHSGFDSHMQPKKDRSSSHWKHNEDLYSRLTLQHNCVKDNAIIHREILCSTCIMSLIQGVTCQYHEWTLAFSLYYRLSYFCPLRNNTPMLTQHGGEGRFLSDLYYLQWIFWSKPKTLHQWEKVHPLTSSIMHALYHWHDILWAVWYSDQ